ncbi:hypothetical protein F2P81_006697 [Scophthalmus maximus]|uniref:Uncharacterized protein n=1 Tax=Scophthalmus maximus TaxID=52904 RepID=A0A6A4T7H2_SCOMX|nr:hypothetical protein F2P81_006697 [Scophthalmus maximus]
MDATWRRDTDESAAAAADVCRPGPGPDSLSRPLPSSAPRRTLPRPRRRRQHEQHEQQHEQLQQQLVDRLATSARVYTRLRLEK